MAALNKLNLKEVQNETAKHLFYTRISTIHPFQASDEQSKKLPEHIKDPLLGCMDIQPWYSRASRQLVESISGDLDDIPLDKVVEYTVFKDSLEQSIARVMYQIEQHRMARLRDQTPLLGPPLLYTLEKDLVDNRYFTVLPDFQHSMSPSFAELSSAGPLPQRIWIAASTRADLVQTLIQSRTAPSPSQIEHIMAAEDVLDLEVESGQAKLELTAIESRSLIQEWKLIGHLLIDLLLPPNERLDVAKLAHEKYLEIFDHMRSNLTDPLDSVYGDRDLPMWTLLHFSFTELEQLKAWERVCGIWIATKKKDGKHGRLPKQPSVEQISTLKEEVRRRAITVQNEIRAWKIRLEKTGTERILEMMKRESNLEQILGVERLKRYARSMRDSAVDALDGVIKVKVGW
jgi:N-terminal acetyltransferase B complex non-catalytic subunit